MKKYKLQDLIDIDQFQMLQDKLNEIYSFPSAIIDNEGNVLTATAWQDICTKFHRQNPACEKECKISDQYIVNHIHEADPTVSYKCPHGLIDNATPIIIDGTHYGNYFTGQFFMETPDLDFFKKQAKKYGFNENEYLEAVKKVPVWTKQQLNNYLFFIKGLIEVISNIGLKNLKEIEIGKQLQESEEKFHAVMDQSLDGILIADEEGILIDWNRKMEDITGYKKEEFLNKPVWHAQFSIVVKELQSPENLAYLKETVLQILKNPQSEYFGKTSEQRICRKDGSIRSIESVIYPIVMRNRFLIGSIIRDITERKQAENALAQSKALLHTIVNSTSDMIWSVDHVKYGLLSWNRAFEDFFLNEHHLKVSVGMCPDDLFPVGSPFIQKWCDLYRNAISNGSYTVEYMVSTESIILQMNMNLLVEEGKLFGVSVFGKDITKSRMIEQTLRESEEKFRTMAEQLNNLIALTDESGIITYASPASMNLFGITPAEMTGCHFISFLAESDIPLAMDSFQKALIEGRNSVRLELQMKRKDGSVFIGELNGSRYTFSSQSGTLVTIQDISERKFAEEELKENEEKYRQLVELSSEAIVAHQNGKFVFVNNAAVELFGASHYNDLIGQPILKFIHPEFHQIVNERDGIIINQGEKVPRIEEKIIQMDGTLIDVEVTAIPFLFHSQPAVQAVIHEITDRKKAEEKIKSLNDELEKRVNERTSQLLIANNDLQSFSYTVSHDLRAPVRALDGFASILLKDYSKVLDEEGKNMLGRIVKSAEKMGKLIDDLLSFSRLGRTELRFTTVDMYSMVNSVFQEFLTEENKGKIDFRLQNIPVAFGDPSLLRQVWSNLIGNAIKFSSHKPLCIIEVGCFLMESENIYFVKDYGAGFNMAYVGKLFNVFERLHPESEFEGTGVGLAIVNRIIQRMNGRTWAESKVNEGATFYFTVGTLKE